MLSSNFCHGAPNKLKCLMRTRRSGQVRSRSKTNRCHWPGNRSIVDCPVLPKMANTQRAQPFYSIAERESEAPAQMCRQRLASSAAECADPLRAGGDIQW